MSKLLFDEQPLMASRELAKLIGLNEAIVLQQVHYWLEINRKADKNFRDGRHWTYNSIKKWHENDFDFWSFDTVKRTFASLVKKGFFIVGNYNKLKFDQTRWYSINYEALETLNLPISAKCTNGKVQNAAMEKCKMHLTIPKNNTENNLHKNILSYPIISVLSEKENFSEEKTEELKFDKPLKKLEPKIGQKKEDLNTHATQSKKYTAKPSISKYSINDIADVVKGNIYYDYILTDNRVSKSMLDEVVSVITTTVCTEFRDGYVSMGGERIDADIVKDVFLKLDKDDIDCFFEFFNQQTEPITKMSAYIRTSLFRNHQTINHHVQNQVHTDMPWLASPKLQGRRWEKHDE